MIIDVVLPAVLSPLIHSQQKRAVEVIDDSLILIGESSIEA